VVVWCLVVGVFVFLDFAAAMPIHTAAYS